MNIMPNSEIRILQNIPLDSNYENTLYFNNIEEQTSYFKGKTKTGGLITEASYVRLTADGDKGKIRMSQNPNFFFDCNYIMFKNTNYENKWFYAFIKEVEWVNNELSKISFEIDVLQTYHFDYKLKECFIERQHTASDRIGEHIISEPVKSDDFKLTKIINNLSTKVDSRALVPVVATTTDPDVPDTSDTSGLYNGIYSGAKYRYFSDYKSFKNWFDRLMKLPNGKEAIIVAYMCPLSILNGYLDPTTNIGVVGDKPYEYSKDIEYIHYNENGVWGTWKPLNNKLYTAPYCSLLVSNNTGSTAEYMYEKWNGLPSFTLKGVGVYPPTVSLVPKGYRLASSENSNFDEALILSGWSTISYSNDSFTAWAYNAQNKNLGNIAGSVALGLAGTFMGNPLLMTGAAMNLVHGVSSTVSGGVQANLKPNEYNGGNNGNHLYTATSDLNYVFYDKRVVVEKAKIIDNFFTKYGYAINKIALPNRKTRKSFTYIKTADSNMYGNLPVDDMRKINDIFNKGVAFWSNHVNIGNYSVDNGVLNG